MTTTIRVSLHTRDLLQESQMSGSSMQAVLEQAFEQYRPAASRGDQCSLCCYPRSPEAWANLEQERLAWEQPWLMVEES